MEEEKKDEIKLESNPAWEKWKTYVKRDGYYIALLLLACLALLYQANVAGEQIDKQVELCNDEWVERAKAYGWKVPGQEGYMPSLESIEVRLDET